ncbi:MAG: RNA polymerase factor sigma-54 [Dysgonamonadaceae bacterium]|jgi:RNA polymerase sigma-54 factor|nr:RNA polymerase factor sigma-54 [Dysgonamonadaceae bacterium]
MIRQQLSQKLQQKLSPWQIQQIKMLELSALELENRINQELEENPALEQGEDYSSEEDLFESIDDFNPDNEDNDITQEELALGDYMTEDDIPDYKFYQNNYSSDNKKEEIPYADTESFQEYLFNQLRLRNLTDEEVRIGEYLIGNIDEDGYLRRDLSAVSDDLAFKYGTEVTPSKIEKVLQKIKELDPPGVAASSLQECLLLQLKRKSKTTTNRIAFHILADYFEEFSRKHFDKIKKGLDISEADLKDAIKDITLLNPKPGNSWDSALESKMTQVNPDFVVEIVNDKLVLNLPQQNIPELRINRDYLNMLEDYSKNKKNQTFERKEALLFVKQKLDSAKWFIDVVKQYQSTLKNVMLAIIDIQHDFFLTGEEQDLRPMILKDVADLTGLDISTISRVSNSKYVQTNYGIFPLKYFFSEALQNDAGEEVSTREVKAILKACIEEEDKSKPLTDDALVKALKNKGYEVARRTIAKYREQMGISVARLRKEI